MLDFVPRKSTDFLPQEKHPTSLQGWEGGTGITRHILILTKKYIKNAYGIKPRKKGV